MTAKLTPTGVAGRRMGVPYRPSTWAQPMARIVAPRKRPVTVPIQLDPRETIRGLLNRAGMTVDVGQTVLRDGNPVSDINAPIETYVGAPVTQIQVVDRCAAG